MSLLTEDVVATLSSQSHDTDYIALNAKLNLWGTDENGNKIIQFDADKEAARQYFLQNINPNTVFFHSLQEKLHYLVQNDYYEAEFLAQYDFDFVKKVYQKVYDHKFRFPSFVGAYKFYTAYALKTFDGKRFLERYEDRIAAVALFLGRGDKRHALDLAEEMITGRLQPATPTFLNAGKKQRGSFVSCFLINVSDDLNAIGRAINSALQLSKRGGGVALGLSSIRAKGDPIKKIENQSSGVIPIMKLLEDSFSYANQLGARQGAGAVYLNAHHMDIESFLDTKRENADEKIRIKTLSLGVVIPDITFELARKGEPMYLFSPYDVEKEYGVEFAWLNVTEKYREMVDNPRIRKKKIDPRSFLASLAEIQMESGYPYIMFEDAVNRANPLSGKIIMSNLCSEILQPQTNSIINDRQEYETVGKDISCNLASLNVLKMLRSPDFGKSIEVAIRSLTTVSEVSDPDMDAVPSIQQGNRDSHAIGLGAMNLAGAFGHFEMYYGDEESLDLTTAFFQLVNFHSLKASNKLAKEARRDIAEGLPDHERVPFHAGAFKGFEESSYADGSYFDRFVSPEGQALLAVKTDKVRLILQEAGISVPTLEDWQDLSESVRKYGLRNSHRLAVAPTGSISYVSHSTSSIHPITSPGGIELRKEGRLGRVAFPAPEMNNSNREYFVDAYTVGPEKLIDIYSVASYFVDQGMSLTLFLKEDSTTRDINRAHMYAFSKGKPSAKASERTEILAKYPQAEIKTIYYVRLAANALDSAMDVAECVSCSI